LRVFIERNAARALYNASLMMEVPQKTLTAKEEGHDLTAAIRATFDELQRQLQKHKATLRREPMWKRIFKRKQLRQTRAAPGGTGESDREIFFQLVSPHLEWLDHFIRHLMRYSESVGELVRDEVTPEDVIDWSLVRAYSDFHRSHSVGDIRSWLTRLTVDRLEQEIRRSMSERQTIPVRLDEDIGETPRTEWMSMLGEEISYFYGSDEDLQVEDIVADSESSDPEAELLKKETRAGVRSALREMPDSWRRVLLMHYGDERPIETVAKSLDRPLGEIRRILRYSTAYVRQKLIQAGCMVNPTRKAA
jgi:RNA polymerase sigma factor (sigma-70 family)